MEGLLNEHLALPGIEFLPAHQGCYCSSLVPEQLPITEPLQYGVCGGTLPAQPFLSQFCKMAGRKRFVIPDNISKDSFNLTKLLFSHWINLLCLLLVVSNILLSVDSKVK